MHGAAPDVHMELAQPFVNSAHLHDADGHASRCSNMTRFRPVLGALAVLTGALPGFAVDAAHGSAAGHGAKSRIYVIPVRDEIAKPVLYVLRRGLKEAIETKADAVVLDMETPGGSAAVMLEMMEALDNFQGRTITYVDNEAVSAGAIIASVTDEIYFAPKGVMGAAEVITSTGADVGESLKRKLDSYLSAKIAAYSQGDSRRADVIRAMMDPQFELKLDGKVLKPKGELLTLTAEQAIVPYGDPPVPLLADGIARNLDSLLRAKFGDGDYEEVRLEVTWSEQLARYLAVASPILMGLGLLGLFIEFKTPGFGWIGFTGIALLLLVFFGHYVAGLSGHEPALLFGAGLVLLALEILVFPGAVFPAVAGVACLLVSLIWAGADLWPNQPIRLSGDAFVRPAMNLAMALAIAGSLFVLVLRYLPKSWFWDRLVLAGSVGANAQTGGLPPRDVRSALIGAEGVATTGMYPSGEVEIDGRRYQARLDLGHIEAGTPIVVVGRSDFGLLVERKIR